MLLTSISMALSVSVVNWTSNKFLVAKLKRFSKIFRNRIRISFNHLHANVCDFHIKQFLVNGTQCFQHFTVHLKRLKQWHCLFIRKYTAEMHTKNNICIWIKCFVIHVQCSKGPSVVGAVLLTRLNRISQHLAIKESFHQYRSAEHETPYLLPKRKCVWVGGTVRYNTLYFDMMKRMRLKWTKRTIDRFVC